MSHHPTPIGSQIWGSHPYGGYPIWGSRPKWGYPIRSHSCTSVPVGSSHFGVPYGDPMGPIPNGDIPSDPIVVHRCRLGPPTLGSALGSPFLPPNSGIPPNPPPPSPPTPRCDPDTSTIGSDGEGSTGGDRGRGGGVMGRDVGGPRPYPWLWGGLGARQTISGARMWPLGAVLRSLS